MELNITVKNKIAVGDRRPIICHNTDYTVRFDFDEEWDAYPLKTMRVETVDGYTDVAFQGTVATLPAVEHTTIVKIGVFAGNLHTTTPAVYGAIYSILDTYGHPIDPTDSIYDQIMEIINGFEASVSKSGRVTHIKLVDPSGTTEEDMYDGTAWYCGDDPDDTEGVLGDMYLCTDDVYIERTVKVGDEYITEYVKVFDAYDILQWTQAAWHKVGNVKGTDGEDGTRWYAGGDPYMTPGNPGDLFLVLTDSSPFVAYDVLEWRELSSGDDWVKVGNIKGADGQDGSDGEDGHTPVRGTDYWTAADQSQIVADVIAALPTWTGGSY